MGRIFRTRRQLVTTTALAAVLAVALVALASVASGAGTTGTTDTPAAATLVGVPIPAEYLPTIKSAAVSCPMLSPARLAGQVMANSSFDAEHTTNAGGVGLAGMTDTSWDRWKPEPLSRRGDATANVVAMAHDMCDLSGQLRVAGVDGDAWRNALAAYTVGIDTVKQSKGVPVTATGYVTTVVAYATWYSAHDALDAPDATSTSTPTPAPSPSAGKATPTPGHTPTPTGKPTPSPSPTPVTLAGLCNSGAGAPICLRLVNQQTGKCAGLDGTNLTTVKCPGDASTVWYWMQFSPGLTHIVNNKTGECMDSNDNSVYLWRCQTGDRQEGWSTVAGTQEIQHKASSRCLDGPAGLVVVDCNGTPDGYQQWQQTQL